ncbi:hypothetical protein GGX14DRAFT_567320 [Mycena pura]|uniref:Uncharacterized protein n=1 Tax=Mycena pura TaxID=153505 RepID=A0AAD6VB84_9AGAR|nr:hypothetical protein GGX14DRAFT_567320 [Mycena pura]
MHAAHALYTPRTSSVHRPRPPMPSAGTHPQPGPPRTSATNSVFSACALVHPALRPYRSPAPTKTHADTPHGHARGRSSATYPAPAHTHQTHTHIRTAGTRAANSARTGPRAWRTAHRRRSPPPSVSLHATPALFTLSTPSTRNPCPLHTTHAPSAHHPRRLRVPPFCTPRALCASPPPSGRPPLRGLILTPRAAALHHPAHA